MADTPRNTLPIHVQDPRALQLWFVQIYGKIDELNAGIFAKHGVFIFKTHVFSQDELLDHPLLDDIRALCGQIDTIVQSWLANQNVDAKLASLYYENRILVEQRLSSLRAEIVARKPTFWEALLHTIEGLIRQVLKFLPALPPALLDKLGIHIAAAQRFLSDRSKEIDDFLDGLLKE
jgi:hypothetical protein